MGKKVDLNGSGSNGIAQRVFRGVSPAETDRSALKIATVSHTLDNEVAERLRHFAFRERISESAVIEYALRGLFESAPEPMLGIRLREAGASLRRRR